MIKRIAWLLVICCWLLAGQVSAQRDLTTNEAVKITVGPFYDSTDGITPETGLDVTTLTVELLRQYDDGSTPTRAAFVPTASGGSNDMVLITSSLSADFSLELTAAQLNFTGFLRLRILDTDSASIAACPIFDSFRVTAANVVDAGYGTDKLQTHTAEMTSNIITAAVIQDAAIDNATWAADVGSTAYATNIIALAVRKVLDELKLDHLVAVADNADPVQDSIIAKMASDDGDWSKFDKTEDSLRASRVRGDSAWITATGFSTHDAQQVWEYNISALANTAQAGGILIWMFNVGEGDEYIDTTQTPWQLVRNKKGTPGTEYLRKNLFDISGGNVTSITTVIGKQTEP